MPNNPHRPTVVNVDDNEAARYVRSRILADAGYRVFDACSGEEALRLIATLQPALVVLDVKLPGLDGFEVCHTIKRDPATAHVMVLLVSAVKGAATDRAAGLDSGADAYLVEPIEPVELIASVRALLRLAAREAENRRVEQALRESESFYRQTLESIPGMVFTNRPDGSCDYVSQQWADFTGFPAQEQLGSGWVRMLHPDDRERAVAAWRDAVEGRGHYDLEYRIRRNDGHYEWFKARGHAIRDERGSIVRWFGTAVNVDDLKRAQEELRRWKDELEHRVRERTHQLIGSQQRLRSLASELSLTEQRTQRKLAKDLHDYLAQLLVVGRMKTGQLKKEPGLPPKGEALTADLDGIFEQALTYTRTMIAELSPPSFHESGFPAALAWLAQRMQKDGLWVDVESDRDRVALTEEQAVLLFQSARELLMNVLKHAGVDRATVRLTVRDDDEVRLSVEDKGKGLGPGALQRAAEPGHLGLFAVRERMEAMGGRLEVASSPGQGTTATLVLPLGGGVRDERDVRGKRGEKDSLAKPGGPVSQVSPFSPLSQSAKIRVLVVDDHALVRQGIGTLLDTYTDVAVVGEAGDGLEAVAMTERHEPDVVVMDFTMPKMNGAEATRQIKRRRPRTVVIGLSVTDQEHVRCEMLAAGAAGLVSKDSAPDELYRVIVAAV